MEQCKENEVSINETDFYKAIQVFIKKSHVINNRLWGCVVIKEEATSMLNITLENSLSQCISNNNVMRLYELIKAKEDDIFEVVITKLLPKTYSLDSIYQINVINRSKTSVYIHCISTNIDQTVGPDFPFAFQLINGNISLEYLNVTEDKRKSLQWLNETVVPQIKKWSKEVFEPQYGITTSLSLVDLEKYYHKYNQLKIKYGFEMVKIWPECTDPSKFVYEDVAIASYLLLLWESERHKKNESKLQSFVDLGCGNGLLVHILSSEGHSGLGIDIRKRNIWDIYPSHVKLEVGTITPSDKCLFPSSDWIIGNHSDELSPWVPVIAALSSHKSSFFLLPCCAFNFDGTKYQRKDASQSTYSDYINYILQLTQKCGFVASIDRLKIPSTKRICIIGMEKNYSVDNYKEVCYNIHELVKGTDKNNTQNWNSEFKARNSKERVRNCTSINKDVIKSVVQIVTKQLLHDFKSFSLKEKWFEGHEMSLKELAQNIPQDYLNVMKNECGGLQTLLRNHHHIFLVRSGLVKFRYPKSKYDVTQSKKMKSCWFFKNHPQGCPLSDDVCSYLHIPEEFN